MQDTGWNDLTLKTGFTHHSNDSKAQYRVKNGVVFLRGAIKNTSAGTYSNTPVATLPSKYAPSLGVRWVQQGSQANKFLIDVTITGVILVGRYTNNTTMNNQTPANSWLNIYGSYLLE